MIHTPMIKSALRIVFVLMALAGANTIAVAQSPLEWRRISTSQTPPNAGAPLTWNSACNAAVTWQSRCFSPTNANTWLFVNNAWQIGETTDRPPTCEFGHIAHNVCTGRTVQFGGPSSDNFPREYDCSNWVAGPVGPCNRDGQIMLTLHDRCSIFMSFGRVYCGGGIATSECFEYNGTTWTARNPTDRPLARFGHAAAYDPQDVNPNDGYVLIFGGTNGTNRFNDTWKYHFGSAAWENIPTTVQPSARNGATMVFDPLDHAFYLVGGTDSTGARSDTWRFNGAAWEQVAVTGAPAAGNAHAVWDPLAQRFLALINTQTWELDQPAAAEVGPDKLNFGRAILGRPGVTRTAIVRNTGSVGMQITAIPALAPPFAIVSAPSTPLNLAAGESRTFQLRFSPTSAGRFRTTVQLQTNSPTLGTLMCQIGGEAVASTSAFELGYEDFNDIVTPADAGYNDFGGNTGAVQSDCNGCMMTTQTLDSDSFEAPGQSLSIATDFSAAPTPEAFAGWFSSTRGQTQALFVDQPCHQVCASARFESFPNIAVNFLDVFGANRGEPDKSIDEIRFALRNVGGQTVTIRFELKDALARGAYTRRALNATQTTWLPVTLTVPGSFTMPGGFDWTRVKEFNVIVEYNHVADNVHNPVTSRFLIDNIRFADLQSTITDADALTDAQLLELIERRAFQYYLDHSSRDPRSLDVAHDRSIFSDLLTVGGTNPAVFVVAASRGWLTRAEAAARVLNLARFFDNESAMGCAPSGTLGHRGWYYHFLGTDGRRKLNVDFPATPDNECRKTVELSTIDTTLLLCGFIAASEYFDSTQSADETEIRGRSQAIWSRVDFPFMLADIAPGRRQFYLGWKPVEDCPNDPLFSIPDGNCGYWSGAVGQPATLDYYTDEAVLMCLLAIASPNPAFRIEPEVYFQWLRSRRTQSNGYELTLTYPGALFTYQFARMFLDTPCLGRDRRPEHGIPALHLADNSREAIRATRNWAISQGNQDITYSAERWGLTAHEDADDCYRAHAAPPVAIANPSDENGSVAPYGALCSLPFAPTESLAALRHLMTQTDAWREMGGMADALNLDIGAAGALSCNGPYLRAKGEWYNRAGFAIDRGPELLLIENYRTNLVARLFHQNRDVGAALAALFEFNGTTADIDLDGDVDSTDAELMARVALGLSAAPDQVTRSDQNCDQRVDGDDIGLFIARVIAP